MMASIPLSFIRGVALAVAFASLFIIARQLAVGAPPSPRLGLRGLKRQRRLAKQDLWSSIDPLVRWLGARLNGLVDDKMRASLDETLTLAGDPLGLLPEEFVALCALSGTTGLVLGIGIDAIAHVGIPVVIAPPVLFTWLPFASLAEAQQERFKHVNRGLPSAVDLLALSMGAGLDFVGGLRQVVEKFGAPDAPIIDEFTLMLQGLQLGQTRVQVLRRLSERVPTNAMRDFVGAVIQAEERGNPLVPVLKIQAEVCRQRRTVAAEEGAAKAGVAMALPLVMIFLAVLILILVPIALKVRNGF